MGLAWFVTMLDKNLCESEGVDAASRAGSPPVKCRMFRSRAALAGGRHGDVSMAGRSGFCQAVSQTNGGEFDQIEACGSAGNDEEKVEGRALENAERLIANEAMADE